MPDAFPRRILVYTHNSIGLGHAVRVMAVIDGMRAVLPESDFLVLSGGSAPQIFLAEGVETVKLPGLRHDLEAPGGPFRPRYLASLSRNDVLAWRQALIAESLRAFAPDLVMVEHSLAGLMGEAAPLLAASRTAAPGGHVLVHLSRGVYRDKPALLAPPGDYAGLPPQTVVTGLYDALYVLEDRTVVDVNREFFGHDPAIEDKILYLGRITARNPDELRPPETCRKALGLAEPPLLVSLGRHGPILQLHERILAAAAALDPFGAREILVVLDPYLDRNQAADLKALGRDAPVRFPPFLPCLAETMAASALTVCRAGYNTVNELLLTGARGLILPERHPSREQERRVAGLSHDQLRVIDEETFVNGDLEGALRDLLTRPPAPPRARFDRFRVGRRIVEDVRRVGV